MNDLEQWLQARPAPLAEVLRQIAAACARIAGERRAAGVGGSADEAAQAARGCMSEALADCKQVAGWVGNGESEPVVSPLHGSGGAYLVLFDALHGACAVGASAGSVFSVLPHLFRGTPASAAAFMQPGRRQVAAGYALYGAATVLALSTGAGVQLFTLDPASGRWLLSCEQARIPCGSSEFAINSANQRYWEQPVQRYVAECVAGQSGPRGRDFSMHWLGSAVAEAHRILTAPGGGVFLEPRDNREPYRPGRMRLMIEAAPLAYLVEQAGGAAVNGSGPLLELVADALQQQVCVIFGSKDEVERLVDYHADPSQNVSWQLFKTRSLFIQPQA